MDRLHDRNKTVSNGEWSRATIHNESFALLKTKASFAATAKRMLNLYKLCKWKISFAVFGSKICSISFSRLPNSALSSLLKSENSFAVTYQQEGKFCNGKKILKLLQIYSPTFLTKDE
jgi:hypothetical protein